METRLKHYVAALTIAGIISVPAVAQNSDQNSSLNNPYKKKPVKHHVHRVQADANASASAITHTETKTPATTATPAYPVPAQGPISQQLSGKDLVRIMSESQEYLPFDLDVPGQAFVSTGPYVGVTIQFAGGNLIINSPSVNTDLQLLSIRKSITTQLNALAGEVLKEPYHSHLLFSGIVEGQGQYFNYSKPNNGDVPPTNFDVTNVTVDMTVFGPSDWLLGFVETTYNNSSPIYDGVFTSSSYFTPYNSRVFVNKAFVTLGDLACSPFYGTFGQFYVPFGSYGSIYVSDPFTKTLGRIKARAIELAFAQQGPKGFYGSAFFFRGDSHVPLADKINNGGLNLGYNYNVDPISLNAGGSVIANIADSVGMQFGTGFQTHEMIAHRVPAYDVRFNLGIGTHWDFIGEYVWSSTFNPNDMSYDNHGARPSAFDLEASYSFSVRDWPSAVGVGYQHSYQSIALGIPMSRYTLVFNTSFLRNTLQSLEFRHDREYAASIPASGADNTPPYTPQTGKGDNAIIGQFDFYF